MSVDYLTQLQAVIEGQIPLCAQMGIRVCGRSERGLELRAPLAGNQNHQQTAFAGSLNALCTVAGWGAVFLLARQHDLPGDIVIRRGTIKYLKPVVSPELVALAKPVRCEDESYFVEMVREKGQAKLDLHVEIASEDASPAVSFHGSYVLSGIAAE